MRTGGPWRDLPASFGDWNSVFTRFRDWVRADIWQRLFDAVSDQPDMEYAMVDEEMHKWRHLTENFLCKIKEFKRIGMRADKTDRSFSAMIDLAADVVTSR